MHDRCVVKLGSRFWAVEDRTARKNSWSLKGVLCGVG